jgi:hypothetical protein
MLGNSTSGDDKSINVDTDLQAGDRDYKGIGGTSKVDKNSGNVAGNNQNNYKASKLTVNESDFWSTLLSFIVGFLLCGLATFFAGWYLPQPKHLQKLKKIIKKPKSNC